MSATNDGGPAFPLQAMPAPGSEVTWGMSLRQWYVGQALQALIIALGPMRTEVHMSQDEVETMIADGAVRMADATLRALNGGAK